MLHPCDLHVLTTPPAFRLSQDQTLQLNFLAQLPPHASRCEGGETPPLQELSDSFASCVCPRNEFIQLTRSSYRSVARLKHLHWLRTGRVSGLPFNFKEMISDHFFACTTKMSEQGRENPAPTFLSAQPRANKPSVRRLTSSRRFDYLIVKEHVACRARVPDPLIAASDLAIWLKTMSPNQRKERNDNAEFDLVKRVFAGSKELANTRQKRHRRTDSKLPVARNLSVWANSLHERRAGGRVCCILSRNPVSGRIASSRLKHRGVPSGI